MYGLQWLRRLIRRNTSPIEETTAHKWKQRLSIAYMLLAWNAFGFVAYSWYKGRGDWADYYGFKTEEDKNMPNNEYFARTIGRPGTTKLITMRGFSVVDTKDFDYEAEKEKERQLATEQRPLNMEEKIARKRRLIEAELARIQAEEAENSQ
uniref:Soluble starch synthase 3, chloroplastic/amyloplastic n=2 Tax=Lygus hesperus TaxID=30085 RepID=A0A0A9WH98_LYGHE